MVSHALASSRSQRLCQEAYILGCRMYFSGSLQDTLPLVHSVNLLASFLSPAHYPSHSIEVSWDHLPKNGTQTLVPRSPFGGTQVKICCVCCSSRVILTLTSIQSRGCIPFSLFLTSAPSLASPAASPQLWLSLGIPIPLTSEFSNPVVTFLLCLTYFLK